MNNAHTEIVFVLDRSGSMQAMVEPAISGFNRLLREQQQVPGHARFTLVLFDDQYELPFHSVPIAEVVELDTSTFVPRGSTALLDAIGRTIDDLGSKLAATPEKDHPNQVIIAILTDGEENASTRYTWEAVAKRIRHQSEKYQWQFLFLGANQDAIATAGRMSIQANNTTNFAMNEHSYTSSKGALSRKMSAFRRSSQGDNDAATVHDAAAPLESLREEEERKDDGK
jgi:Mg-chelatase subunit ChlD